MVALRLLGFLAFAYQGPQHLRRKRLASHVHLALLLTSLLQEEVCRLKSSNGGAAQQRRMA